ncbi:hypothetical protein Plhal304r1_c101g0175051 [Plasmopara halstedii]
MVRAVWNGTLVHDAALLTYVSQCFVYKLCSIVGSQTLQTCTHQFSKNGLNLLNLPATSLLLLIRIIATYFEKSFTHIKLYLATPFDLILIGPMTSVCTHSSTRVVFLIKIKRNVVTVCWPFKHPPYNIFVSFFIVFVERFVLISASLLGCPMRACQSFYWL